VEGEHIGEIGLIYKCNRTASIISRNYNTLGRLQKDRFRVVASEYPEFFASLKKHINGYKYKKKTFVFEVFKKIEFLRDLSDE
jgi:CRP-like cAMP-binding protein